jgi:hypothetical protein
MSYLYDEDRHAHISSIERLNTDVISFQNKVILSSYLSMMSKLENVRKFDVFDSLLLFEDPIDPATQTIRHSTQDDFGHLQSRITQTNYLYPQRKYTTHISKDVTNHTASSSEWWTSCEYISCL